MPALDVSLVERMGRELHAPHALVHSGMGEQANGEMCPWTLFLTMALTLLKGVMPHVPKVLPLIISDPEMRERAIEHFSDEKFISHIDDFFIENIKTDIQAPLNEQILKSSDSLILAVDMMNALVRSFTDNQHHILAPIMGMVENNDLGKTDDKPRAMSTLNAWLTPDNIARAAQFAQTLYQLA